MKLYVHSYNICHPIRFVFAIYFYYDRDFMDRRFEQQLPLKKAFNCYEKYVGMMKN